MSFSLPIAKPPWSQCGRRLESATRKALYDFSLVEGVDKVAIALSGGKDSLTLLYLLHAISGRGFPPFTLHAIHVDGAFSCGANLPKGYLQAICDSLDVPLTICKTEQTLDKLQCYSCARERRKLIFDAAKEAGATTVAFGHHRDDSIQTLLMNLLHKGEFAANLPKVPMEHYGVTIIRPLIFVTEHDIRTFSQEHGFARITCQCPVGQDSQRKQTEQLITTLEQIFPNCRTNLAQAAHRYGDTKALNP